MGIRCTQPYGLPAKATEFLRENAVRKNPCEHCGRDSGYATVCIGKYGMFDEMELLSYTLIDLDDQVAEEFIQRTVWSSGPMIWLGLRLGDGTTIVWADEEMVE